MKLKKIDIIKFFSIYIVLIPILQYYKSPISSLNLATLIAVLFVPVFLLVSINKPRVKNENTALFPMVIYFLFITINVIVTMNLYNYSFSWGNLSAYFRLVLLFVSLFFLGYAFFDVAIAIKAMENILVFAAFAIIVHTVLFSAANIDFNFIAKSLLTDTIEIQRSARSGGIYMEPAHYAQSTTIYLCMFLFSPNVSKLLSKKKAIFIVVGMVVSGSGQGYLMLALIYGIWLMKKIMNKKITIRKILIIVGSLLVIFVLALILLQIPFFQNAVSRLISDDGSLGGTALSGRTYTNKFFDRLSDVQKWYGVGFGHLKDITLGYCNSMYSHLIQCGYLSMVIFGFVCIYYWLKGPMSLKAHVLLYVVMFYFTSMASPMMLCFIVEFYSAEVRETRKNNKLMVVEEI